MTDPIETTSDELDDDQLDQVAGGVNINQDYLTNPVAVNINQDHLVDPLR